jgi:hypothetical protein
MLNATPERPAQLDPLAEALLSGLQSFPACHHLILGGYITLEASSAVGKCRHKSLDEAASSRQQADACCHRRVLSAASPS